MDIKKRVESANEEIQAYREWLDEQFGPAAQLSPQAAAARETVTIVAEGDSWFNYIIGKDVVWWLRRAFHYKIHEVAYPGATLNSRKRCFPLRNINPELSCCQAVATT